MGDHVNVDADAPSARASVSVACERPRAKPGMGGAKATTSSSKLDVSPARPLDGALLNAASCASNDCTASSADSFNVAGSGRAAQAQTKRSAAMITLNCNSSLVRPLRGGGLQGGTRPQTGLARFCCYLQRSGTIARHLAAAWDSSGMDCIGHIWRLYKIATGQNVAAMDEKNAEASSR